MYINFSDGSQPSASTPLPFGIVETILPVPASITAEVLLHPEKIRLLVRSYAIPVGPSQGERGHDARTFIVLSSITWIVFLLSLLTKSFPFPSHAAPSGELSSSWASPVIAPVPGSRAVAVPGLL